MTLEEEQLLRRVRSQRWIPESFLSPRQWSVAQNLARGGHVRRVNVDGQWEIQAWPAGPIAAHERGRDREDRPHARDAGRRYIVYVAKVQGTRVPTYYVGSTARGLRLRRRQHRGGMMARTHCLEKLVPVMRASSREAAERGEARVARALRSQGYTVHGDY